MNPEKGHTYFRNSLNVAIQELTGTDYETYMNLHLADILHLSYRLRYWQLMKKPGVGHKSVQWLFFLRGSKW